jgi:CheY-like chemotaxis protein
MPVMDGLTCARMIRKAEGEGLVRGHVPIISVTANARSEQVEIARAAGMVRKFFLCLIYRAAKLQVANAFLG